MEKKVKELIAADRGQRRRYDGFVVERGQGVLFFLDRAELYNGVYLNTTDEGGLTSPVPYDGGLKTEDDLKAYYEAMTEKGDGD